MDQEPALKELDPERRAAGHEYLEALRSFGLEPDVLAWACDVETGEWRLVLATRFFDVVGPLRVMETLFRAYNASVTPKQVDPFVIQLHSPRQALIQQVMKVARDFGRTPPAPGGDAIAALGGLIVQATGIYRVREPKALNDNLAKKWAQIAHKVEKLAA